MLEASKVPAAPGNEVTMTSATARAGRHARQGSGLVIFAAVLLLVVGFFNLIDGIVAISRSHVFVANAHYVVGDLRSWGWTVLILGVLQLLVAAGVVAGNQAARWTAVVLLALKRHRADDVPAALPVLVPDDHRRRCRRAMGAVRLRQPREPSRLALP
jgi:hypothetical protein